MLYAIGDIHGKAAMLQKLLARILARGLNDDDVLVFLGDYIDRGEDSPGVIEQLLALQQQRPGTVFLRGNHEQMILEARAGPAPHMQGNNLVVEYDSPFRMWLVNGGREALAAYGVKSANTESMSRWDEAIPPGHWQFIEQTRMEYIVGSYHFVHAGLLPAGVLWEGTGSETDPRLWIRDEFLNYSLPDGSEFGGRLVVFGHTPQKRGRPLILHSKIGLDTAAAFGGPLTAGVFDADDADPRGIRPEFIQVFP